MRTILARLSALGALFSAVWLSALCPTARAEFLLTTISGTFNRIDGQWTHYPVTALSIGPNSSGGWAYFPIDQSSEGQTQRIQGPFVDLNAELKAPLMLVESDEYPGVFYEFIDSIELHPMGYLVWHPHPINYRQMFTDGTYRVYDSDRGDDWIEVDSNIVSPNNYNLHGTPHSVSAIELTIHEYEVLQRPIEGGNTFYDHRIGYTLQFFSPVPEPTSLALMASWCAGLLVRWHPRSRSHKNERPYVLCK